MPTHRVAPLLALLLALFAPHARAFLDPPYITPAHPSVGDAISVSIYGGQCDLVHDGVEWPPPVTQKGNEITILFRGIHETNPELCYYGVGTATYPVGSYPAGSYTLHVEWRYISFSGVWIHETIGVIPFTVTGENPPPARPVATPALGVAALGILMLMLAGFAARGLRSRRL